MGEHKTIRILRAVGSAAFVAAVAGALTSCSQQGFSPAATATPVATISAAPDTTAPSASPTPDVASSSPAPVSSPVPTGTPTSGADHRTAVVPFITTADWDASAKALDVSAIVPGFVDGSGSGTCTVTVTSGTTVRTATSAGVAASSYTGCEAVTFHDLAAATWQVRVRFDSSKAAGVSAVRTVRIG